MRSSEDYELFIYSLRERFPSIQSSTISFVRRGASLARVFGELHFEHGIQLKVRERLLFHCAPVIIDWYGYEVWKKENKLYWYDSQPHPNNPELRITHPHHKHIHPNIKHHRIPAPKISFTQANLPVLITEIQALIINIKS